MRNREELEQSHITWLAVRCQQVADDPSVDEATAEKAWELKREWVVFMARDTGVSDLNAKRQIENDQIALKNRMVDFLLKI